MGGMDGRIKGWSGGARELAGAGKRGGCGLRWRPDVDFVVNVVERRCGRVKCHRKGEREGEGRGGLTFGCGGWGMAV